MIISDNRKSELYQFEKICKDAEEYMNMVAVKDPAYYISKSAQKLEPEVLSALKYVYRGTNFQDTIRIESGLKFPDIVVNRYYGVEVKSTTKNQWSVIGGSVAEGTRIEDVELIFLMFGKLCNPVEFKTKRYQDCLSDVAVTHSPRYKIDMNLSEEETIFSKMNIKYDDLRRRKDPLEPVVEYYKKRLKPGESLWWIGNNVEDSSPIKIRLWNTLSKEEKFKLITQCFALFPCIFQRNNSKFDRVSLWLAAKHAVISPSLRDNFSAGGRIDICLNNHIYKNMPRIYYNLWMMFPDIVEVIYFTDISVLMETWGIQLSNQDDLISKWTNLVLEYSDNERDHIKSFLNDVKQETFR